MKGKGCPYCLNSGYQDRTAIFEIFTIDDIFQVIQEGRNAMPSWSIRYSGALDDQQINDLVLYLVQLSSQNVSFDKNVCLNKAASDKALAENAKSASPLDPRDP